MRLQAVDLIRGDKPLPVFSDTYKRFNERLDDPTANVTDFAEIIAADPALTLKLLRLVNSAYYSFRAEISSVSQAITVIGMRDLREMILAICVIEFFSGLPNTLISMKQFWRHSILTGLLVRQLQKFTTLQQGEAMFTAGILQDVGTLLLFNRLPEISRSILEKEQLQDRPRYLLEKEALGFDHAEIGSELLRYWNLPDFLIEVSLAHHQPEKSQQYFQEAQLLNLADLIAARLGDLSWSAEQIAAEFVQNAPGIGKDDLQLAIEHASAQLESVMGQLQSS